MKITVRCFLGVFALAFTSSPGAETWLVVSLHPAGVTGESLVNAIAGTQQVGYVEIAGDDHAAIWTGTAGSFVDLNPAGATASHLIATVGTQQAGFAVIGADGHAGLWAGTAASFSDLNPAGATASNLNAIGGPQQAGSAVIGGSEHAGLWTGTAASFVDLNPGGATDSRLSGTTGTQQAGYAHIGGVYRAGIWTGSAGSFTDLHPAGASASSLNATTGAQQAGSATMGGREHAGIWAGTAASFRDLHPAVAVASVLLASNGVRQVGYIDTGSHSRAGIWNGTADSFLDLQTFLPSNYEDSYAQSIRSDGSGIQVGGYAFNTRSGHSEALLWKLNRAPTVHVSGKKTRYVRGPTLVIHGRASDLDGNLARVEIKAGNARYKKARGLSLWKFTARNLPPGRNRILIRAVDAVGATSPRRKLIVVRI